MSMYACMGVYVQCRHLIPTLNVWEAWVYCTTACPIAIKFPGHGCMDDLTNERSFDLQAMWSIALLGLFLYLLAMGVCTTRHWQTSGRLVQESNVSTVCMYVCMSVCMYVWQDVHFPNTSSHVSCV